MAIDQQEYQTVILAALLHDIGKLLQRGSFGPLDVKGRHPEVSRNFVSAFPSVFAGVSDFDLLKTLVERHHESQHFQGLRVQEIEDSRTRALAYLVSKADNLSSSERGEQADQYQDFKATPLASVFGRVTLTDEEPAVTLRYRASALPATEAAMPVFPEDFSSYAPGEMNDLLNAFGEGFRKTAFGLDANRFDCLVTHLLALLQKYAWCIPSNTQERVPDVSLFDHLKTTAAIASCLYLYHASGRGLVEKEIVAKANAFLLVVGDISGIQSYIFDIATAGAGGVARRLRARSLLIQLLADATSHRLVRALDLTFANIIMASGGKFYLLLPNTEAAKKAVDGLQCEMDDRLLRELNGELAINLASVSFGDDGFALGGDDAGGFGRVLKDLAGRLGERKGRRFERALQGQEGWREDAFLVDVHFEGEGACVSCDKFPRERENLCDHCFRDGEIGKVITRSKYVAFYDDESVGGIPLFGTSASLASSEAVISGNPYLVLKLNDTDCAELGRYPALPRYLANHVPAARDCRECEKRAKCSEAREDGGGEVATFGCLANLAPGKPLLGFLKADVDRLGELFVFGLKREKGGFDTISRLTTLSRQMDLFFTGWVEHLTGEQFRDCYTVFSGGDDLFFVGPWEKVLDLAERIRADLGRYIANPAITLSAGVAVSKPRFPIARASSEANEAVESSKREGRDRFTVLGHTLTWDQWAFVKEQWRLLRAHETKLTSSFVYGLLQYAAMWTAYREGDVLGLRFQPLLAYNLARNVDARKTPEIYRWAEELLAWPVSDESRRTLDNLKLIATLLILGKEGDHDNG